MIQTWLEQQQSRYARRLPYTRAWSADFVTSHERLVKTALTGSADTLAATLRKHTMLTLETLKDAEWLVDAPKVMGNATRTRVR